MQVEAARASYCQNYICFMSISFCFQPYEKCCCCSSRPEWYSRQLGVLASVVQHVKAMQWHAFLTHLCAEYHNTLKHGWKVISICKEECILALQHRAKCDISKVTAHECFWCACVSTLYFPIGSWRLFFNSSTKPIIRYTRDQLYKEMHRYKHCFHCLEACISCCMCN